MNHQEVLNANLVERYLLGEMADAERNAFEEHYFACAICAQDVVTTVKFVDNARRPLFRIDAQTTGEEAHRRAAPPRPPRAPKLGERWWDRWLAFAPKPALAGACACLAAALIWQTVPHAVRPEVTGSYFVTETRSAGRAPRKIIPGPRQQRVALLFNQTDTAVSQFRFVLENAEGRAVQQFDGDAPGDTNDIQVMVPLAGLRSGVYTLRVKNAATQADVAALPFELSIP
jgi:hypothetical protein